MHRTMVLVDVEGFGAPSRTLPHQRSIRDGLYAVLAKALAEAGVFWEACYHEDRGDGVFVLVPSEYPKGPLVEVLPEALVRAVRGHNTTSPAAARARLRLAVHAGEVLFDDHGVTSTPLTTAFRLLDAPPLKAALSDSPGVLAMIVSRIVFDDVVRHSTTIDPATFRPIPVTVKEVHDQAWIALPDHPYPSDPAVLDQLITDIALSDSTLGDRAPDITEHTGTAIATGAPGPGSVTIVGGVHGGGSGITIGAATGDHLTIGTPPPPPPGRTAEPDRPW